MVKMITSMYLPEEITKGLQTIRGIWRLRHKNVSLRKFRLSCSAYLAGVPSSDVRRAERKWMPRR